MPASEHDPADGSVTVVVVNWNRRELLRSCLESLAKQSVTAFEVILVDNGSADGSAEMAESEFGACERFRLRVIRNSGNLGFCAANNQAIGACNSEYVALLNNDAEADPGWIEALAGAFRRGDDIGMAASKILVWEDPTRIDKAGYRHCRACESERRAEAQRRKKEKAA